MLPFFKKKKIIQEEYLPLIQRIMSSPFWDGTDTMIRSYLPADLSEDTLMHATTLFQKKRS